VNHPTKGIESITLSALLVDHRERHALLDNRTASGIGDFAGYYAATPELNVYALYDFTGRNRHTPAVLSPRRSFVKHKRRSESRKVEAPSGYVRDSESPVLVRGCPGDRLAITVEGVLRENDRDTRNGFALQRHSPAYRSSRRLRIL
jgi:hypothetical protein